MAIQDVYGKKQDGAPIERFVLKNKNGLEVRCITYGARLTHILVPGRDGVADVVLGYDDMAGYEADGSSQGAFIGRYANRIEGGTFELDGQRYELTKGADGNYLHGSFSKRVFKGEIIGDNSISLTYISPDGEDGFPGEMWVGIIYTLTDENELVMDYRAHCTRPTHVNFTNHSYFNLVGEGSSSIADHMLQINGGAILEAKEDLCPTGRVLDVAGGVFDFRDEKPIGRDIAADDPQIQIAGGYDHCYILDKNRPTALTHAAGVREPASGRSMRVYTTQPAIQLYTGNFLGGGKGKNGRPFEKQGAFCLETQHYPATPSHPDFPTTLLEPKEKYHEITVLQFDW